MDFNNEQGLSTEVDAVSLGDGLLQAQRAYLDWLRAVFDRYPDLVIENCGSGGMRMDYAMLEQHPVQSISDEEDYRNGGNRRKRSFCVREQQAVWSYPLRDGI